MSLDDGAQRKLQALLDEAPAVSATRQYEDRMTHQALVVDNAMGCRWGMKVRVLLEEVFGTDSTFAKSAERQFDLLPEWDAFEKIWSVLAAAVDARRDGYFAAENAHASGDAERPKAGHPSAETHPNEVARTVLGMFHEIYLSRAGDAATWWLEYRSSTFTERGFTTPQIRAAFDRLCNLGWAKRVGADGAALTSSGIEAWENPATLDDVLPYAALIDARHQEAKGTAMKNKTGVRIFISHSSSDAEIAEKLLLLLEAAFEVPSGTIRCTSVDGYDLKGGDNAPEVLRGDLKGSSIVLGLLTRSSKISPYVLLELGAAWALERKAILLLGPGVSFRDLFGPFRDVHALAMEQEPKIMGLLETIANDTGLVSRNNPPRVQAALKAFIKTVATSQGAAEVAPNAPFRIE